MRAYPPICYEVVRILCDEGESLARIALFFLNSLLVRQVLYTLANISLPVSAGSSILRVSESVRL